MCCFVLEQQPYVLLLRFVVKMLIELFDPEDKPTAYKGRNLLLSSGRLSEFVEVMANPFECDNRPIVAMGCLQTNSCESNFSKNLRYEFVYSTFDNITGV